MIEIVSILVVGALAVTTAYAAAHERAAWQRERADLLDRLMSRDWTAYAALTRQEAPNVELEQMTTDEIEAAWYKAHEREAAA